LKNAFKTPTVTWSDPIHEPVIHAPVKWSDFLIQPGPVRRRQGPAVSAALSDSPAWVRCRGQSHDLFVPGPARSAAPGPLRIAAAPAPGSGGSDL
jgi:hypothetical protein